MEGHCSTGQSQQWAVVPMEEEEEEEVAHSTGLVGPECRRIRINGIEKGTVSQKRTVLSGMQWIAEKQ